jgi:hypothetical protein
MVRCQDQASDEKPVIGLDQQYKYCPRCEMIIAHQVDLESNLNQMMVAAGFQFDPENYKVLGTLDKKDLTKSQKESLGEDEVVKLIFKFKRVLDFEITPAGWYFDGK